MSSVSGRDTHVWHSRLGHASFYVMNKIPSLHFVKLDSGSIHNCIVCPLAKQTRLPFPVSHNTSQKPFHLIHVDLLGPDRVATHSGQSHDVIFHDVIFHDSIYPFHFSTPATSPFFPVHPQVLDSEILTLLPSSLQQSSVPVATSSSQVPSFSISQIPFSSSPQSDSISSISSSAPILEFSEQHQSTSDPLVVSRKSTRVSKPPMWLDDYVRTYQSTFLSNVAYHISNYVYYSHLLPSAQVFLSSTSLFSEPTTYQEACKHLHWVQAMQEEIQALELNNTWSLVPMPLDKVVIGCKWVYEVKDTSFGDVERSKVYLVAKGYTQQEGVDYVETF
ncbi:hypothetical protein GQ457_08G034010 [Hibiscus cannabinus]